MKSPVTSIADDQLAELEADAIARSKLRIDQCEGGKRITRSFACSHCGAGPTDGCQRPLPKRYDDSLSVLSLIARLRAAEADAKRWRHARSILTVEAIETAQSDFINFGLPPAESESIRADQAIDAAMEQKSLPLPPIHSLNWWP